ncbi:MAG: rhodanese-like domain-containing protein, partial [Telluria sp.]
MTTTETILAAARGRAPGQPYAGAVTPEEAFALVSNDPRVKLVDVRTNAERDWVGRVDLPDAQHLAVQWATYPGGVPNPAFGAQLESVAHKDEVLLFLCRSGVRSRHSARVATEHGFAEAYD